MKRGPLKERYVIYVSLDTGEALRQEKARRRGATISDIAEQAIRAKLKLAKRTPQAIPA